MSLTGPTPVTIEDPDDDESTIGFHAPRRPPPRRAVRAPVAVDEDPDDMGPDTLDTSGSPKRPRTAVLVVVGVVLVAVLGLGAAWMMGLFSPEAQAPPAPRKGPPVGAPARPGPQGTAPVKAPASVPAEVAPSKPTEPVLADTATTPDAGLAVAAAATGTATPPAVETVAPATPAEPPRTEPQAPATVDVRFDAPVRTVLGRPGGGKLPINQVVALAPGPLRVQYTCPGKRAPRGIETYNIRPVTGELQTLRVPCRRRR